MSQFLITKISGVRQKHMGVAWGTGLAAAVGAIFLLLGVGMLLDFWLDLPWLVRAIFLAIDLAAVIAIVVKFIALPILFGPDDEEIALMVEDSEPSLATRLIASIQFSRPKAIPAGASVSLVRAMVQQTEGMADQMDFNAVVKTDLLLRLAVGGAIVLLLFASGFLWGQSGNVSTALLERAFLAHIPVPRKTRINVTSGDMLVARGDTVVITAQASGIVPDSGKIFIKFGSGRIQDFAMAPTKDNSSNFASSLDNVQDSFQYYVHLGDANSEWYQVKALIRPVVTQIECQQIYPAYTHAGTVPRALGDLSILQGSRLRLSITVSNKCSDRFGKNGESNHVHLAGSDKDAALSLDIRDPHKLTGEFDVPDKTTGFFIQMVDEHGLASKDPAVYPIEMIPDKDPVVRITYPEKKEELYTRVGKVLIGFDASDDFGLTQLTLKYKVDDGSVQSIPLDIGALEPRNLRNHYSLDLSKITPASTTRPSLEGSNLEYWIEAVDNDNIRKSGPGKGASEHFAVRVVSEAEKLAEIAQELSENVDLTGAIKENQVKLNEVLQTPIIERK